MAGSASVRFTLDDGETLVIAHENVDRIYDLLWGLAHEPGAVFTAALLIEASRTSELARMAPKLTPTQSAVLREAVAKLNAAS
jgi:hypothetical protein